MYFKEVRFRRVICSFLVFCTIFAAIPALAAGGGAPREFPFPDPDIPGWAKPYIWSAYDRDLVSGNDSGYFAPLGNFTRAEAAMLLWNHAGQPDGYPPAPFPDVASHAWYAPAIAWAAAEGIVSGLDDGMFAPHHNITRQEVATLFHRYVGHVDGNTHVPPNVNLNHFTDRGQIAPWASASMRWAVHHRIVQGDTATTLSPTGHATRAQAATLIIRIANFLDGGIFRAAFITQAMSNESQAFSWREFQRLAPAFGFEMAVFAGENEPDVEILGIMTAIELGFDAIFVNPSSINGIVPALRQAREAGVIVGMFSARLPDEYRDAMDFFVGSSDVHAGVQAGQFVSAHFPDGANFVEVGGQAGHSAAMDRHNGFRAGIADNIIELDAQFTPTGWNTWEALAIMEDFITMYGDDIDIVWCHWDNGATGAIYALRNAGIHDVFVIGVDGNSTGYQQVLDGVQALSVGHSFTNMAMESLRLARTMLEGGTVSDDNWIPWDMVTIDTIHNFVWPEW